MTVTDLIDKARRTNNQRDRSDHKHGFGAPGDGPDDLLLRTIMSALQCGMEMQDWDCVAEGYEMAVDLHVKITGKRFDPARQGRTA